MSDKKKYVVRVPISGDMFDQRVEADYFIERDGMLIFLSKTGGQYDDRVAVFAGGCWLSVMLVIVDA